MTVQLLGHNRPLEQTSSGYPITDLTEFPEDVNRVTSTCTGSGTNQVPGVQDSTEANEVELDAEARSSDLETDSSADAYGDNDEKFSGSFSGNETETTDHSGCDMSDTDC